MLSPRSLPMLLALALAPLPAAARSVTPAGPAPTALAYADLADLADSAPLVVRARVRGLARVEAARAPGTRPGTARFYVEANTVALLSGDAPVGARLAFLADLPLDARGKPPGLKKREVLVFARAVPGRPDQLALVAPDAMVMWTVNVEARLRVILAALLAPGAPARITGVREASYVPGTLAGEGETQVFLATADGSAASLTIAHAPGRPVRWGASFSELTADTAAPIRPETLAWYRLACFLPPALPAAAELSPTDEARARARDDYRTALAGLGACERRRETRP